MTMFLVEAEHPTVPGIVRSLHHSHTGAQTAAGELCDQIAADIGIKGCTAVNGLETMQRWIDEWCERDDADAEDSAYVYILPLVPAD
ncbi:hypothetical protein [Aureimonas sp. AU40]|uniref:hypothetical protein n=1 Tax=Aureimonas sp. AU40 TaxID=1637747 RepID=UPI0007819653|nr:hypothetical protein [Aureimonas sp. AU40]